MLYRNTKLGIRAVTYIMFLFSSGIMFGASFGVVVSCNSGDGISLVERAALWTIAGISLVSIIILIGKCIVSVDLLIGISDSRLYVTSGIVVAYRDNTYKIRISGHNDYIYVANKKVHLAEVGSSVYIVRTLWLNTVVGVYSKESFILNRYLDSASER